MLCSYSDLYLRKQSDSLVDFPSHAPCSWKRPLLRVSKEGGVSQNLLHYCITAVSVYKKSLHILVDFHKFAFISRINSLLLASGQGKTTCFSTNSICLKRNSLDF